MRYIEKIVEVIVHNNNSALSELRKPQERFIGTCRDFAFFTCSILRHKGIPARVRCGFASYFHSDWYSDHWVCEYFDKKLNQWLLADAELGNEEKEKYHIDFDPANISREKFLTAGKAWIKARRNQINPEILGVKEIDVKGFWFIKADVIRDLAALNKIELLPWDYTEYMDQPYKNLTERSDDEIQLIDSVAAVTSQEPINLNEVLDFYKKNINVQITNKVKSYSSKDPIDVTL